MSDTLKGCALMVAAMACFALEDGLIKALANRIPPAQIIWMLGLGGALVFALWLGQRGGGLRSPLYLDRRVLVRSGFEVIGTLFFVSAITTIPLATASAVIQATPLVVAMGAALVLGAHVGWRRWAAIGVGFAGVLVILRPGADSFDPAILLAVGATIALSARDLATRTMPPEISDPRLSLHAFAALVPAGLLLQAVQGQPLVWPEPSQSAILGLCVIIGVAAYIAIVAATRLGDIAVVSSLRYSRMVFALVIGMVAFSERPDAATLLGVGIIIVSGLYTLLREARLARLASQT
ncbi:DMT family transporter [Jannaschia sp. KMU-145]|uniref:DMT family transporter n=1 Tax=Jannaschia halovivens TaxID=3388667 RepID=UPI00396B4142